jgi:hypothetical protein
LLIQDGFRIKEIGIKAWLSEQEGRKATGFTYDDVRCGKPDIPLEIITHDVLKRSKYAKKN